MPDNLQIIVHSDKQGAVMYLQGRVSIETSPDFRHHLLAMLRRPSPPKAFAIDLAGVFYMDTSGIATLIQALKVARIAGTAMHLQGLQVGFFIYSKLRVLGRCSTLELLTILQLRWCPDGNSPRRRRQENHRTPRLRWKPEHSAVVHTTSNEESLAAGRELLPLARDCAPDASNWI